MLVAVAAVFLHREQLDLGVLVAVVVPITLHQTKVVLVVPAPEVKFVGGE